MRFLQIGFINTFIVVTAVGGTRGSSGKITVAIYREGFQHLMEDDGGFSDINVLKIP